MKDDLFKKFRNQIIGGIAILTAGLYGPSINNYRENSRLSDEFNPHTPPITPKEPKKPEETVFSDIYQRDIPKSLVDAGINQVDKEIGESILGVHRVMGSARNLIESSKGYCGLDLQDAVVAAYQRLEKFVQSIDISALTTKLGEDNTLVKLVTEAKGKYDFWKEHKNNLEKLKEMFPGPENANRVWSEYFG